jgi:DegV family protein with EDD domain
MGGNVLVRIITDSTADIMPQRAKEIGIEIIYLTVSFGDETFIEGVNLTHEEFYERLAASKTLPTTSQIPPDTFREAFEKHLENDDEIVGIFISSELSGTYNSACVAKGMLESEKIHLVDSLHATITLGLLVEEAVKMRDRGDDACRIAAQVKALIPKLRLYAVIDDLMYLKRGGRLSQTAALVGNILSIHPILSIIDGKVTNVGKCRGDRAVYEFVRKRMREEPIDASHYIALGDTAAPQKAAEWKERLLSEYDPAIILDGHIGSVVGTHIGPGVVGIAYFTASE